MFRHRMIFRRLRRFGTFALLSGLAIGVGAAEDNPKTVDVEPILPHTAEELGEIAVQAYDEDDGAPAENWFGNKPAANEEPNPKKGGSDGDSVPRPEEGKVQ